MDYSSLDRKSLQALAKENGIRANISNAKIVEALMAVNEKAVPLVSTSPAAVPAAENDTHSSVPLSAEVNCNVKDIVGRDGEENIENLSFPQVCLRNRVHHFQL